MVTKLRIIKIIITCYVCTLLPSKVGAQNYIKGVITDSTKTPVPFCAMALLNASDSSLIKGNVTNDNGEFVFEPVAKGDYLIKTANVGFLPFHSHIFKIDSLTTYINLEPIILKSSAFNLKEISISAFKPTVEFKKGVTVLNVENNLISSGNTVLELLKRIPGVTIDNQNNILINGKSGARFLINGRLQYLSSTQMINVLSSMNAESVSTIELIKNPPAKYDAAGTAGLINIVLKKGKLQGFNGSLYNLIGQGTYFRNTTVLSLNFKANKLSVFSNFTYMNLNLYDRFQFNRSIDNFPENDIINEDGHSLVNQQIYTGNLGLEYDVSAKTTIGLNINAGPNNTNNNQRSRISIPSGNTFPYSYINSKSIMTDRFNNPSLNINGLHKFDSSGTQLQFSTDFTGFLGTEYKLNENRFYNNSDIEVSPIYRNRNNTQHDFKIYTQKMDLTKVFKKDLTLEIGAKTSFVNNNNVFYLEQSDSDTGSFYLDTISSNKYNYNERILAGYFTLSKNFKKVNMQAGLRAEQTNINALNKTNGFKLIRNYINFFPSGSIDYTINKKNSLQLLYSYRIDRPDYMSLNPLKVFWDKLDYRAGNPFLKPQYSHNLNLDFNHNSFIINSLSYIQTTNSFYGYSYTNLATKINTDTILNFGSRNNFAYTLFIQKQIKWYNIQFTGVGLYRSFTGTLNGENANSQSYFYQLSINNEFNLPKNIKLQLFGYYNSPLKESLQLYKQYGSLNLAVQKTFFDSKLFLSFGCYDIFYTERNASTIKFSNQTTYFQSKSDSRRVRFTLNYKFGKMKFQQKTKRSNDDESNRLNSSSK
jgi:hypothetical protein